MATRRADVDPAMELHRVQHEDGVLTSHAVTEGLSINPGLAAWCPPAESGHAFSMDVTCIEASIPSLGIGVLPTTVPLQRLVDALSPTERSVFPWYRMYITADKLILYSFGEKSEMALTEKPSSKIGLDFSPGKTPRLSLRIGTKVLDVSAQFPKAIEQADFKPCVIILSAGAKIRCNVMWRNVKRKLDNGAFVVNICRASWEARKYTDMVVITSDECSIPCHRAQLAQASPVFEAELDRWSGAAPRIKVDCKKAVVEAMIAFCYTGQLDSQQDAAEILTLAHRYQIDDLVTLTSERILENLSPETALSAMRALRPLREQAGLQIIWRELCVRAAQDISIIESLGLAV